MRKAIIIIFLCLSIAANATTYYVATNGSNSNNGTSLTTPWLTWQYGFDRLKAGDILYIRGGTYRTTGNASTSTHIYMSNLAGTSSSHITISAYNGEVPVFNLDNITTNQGSCFALLMTGCTYVDVKGLTITGLAQPSSASNVAGFFISGGSSHVTIENCVVHHIGGYGFTCNNSNYITYKNCDAHHCADPYSSSGAWENANGFGVTGGVALNTSDNITYDGCRSWNNADDGFDFYGVDAFITVNNCWSFWNGYDDSFNALGNGQGFKLGPNYSSTYNNTVRRVITNTISAGNKYHGFDKNYGEMGGGCVMKFYNNVAYGNAKYGWEFTYGSNVADVFKNNIAAANGSGPANLESNAISDHNSWNGSTTVSNSDFQNYTISALTAPRQSDGSLPQITAFHLAVGSKLIDAGVDVGLPFTGNAPDLGAFEGQSGTTIQVPVLSTATVENSAPSLIVLSYSTSLANIVPSATSFSVLVNSVARPVSSVTIVGTSVQLTLTSPVSFGNVVTASYIKPASNPLQTTSGGQAAVLVAQAVTNHVTNSTPSYISSTIANATPSVLEMTYDLSLNNLLVPAASSFSIQINAVARTISAVTISGNKVLLTLSSAVKYGDIVTVAYTKPATNPIQTLAGGLAVNLSGKSVINNLINSTKTTTSVTVSMTISPNHVHRTMNAILVYSGDITTLATSLLPELVRISDTSGKLFIEKVLATGITNFRIPLNLRSGVYIVKVLAGGLEMTSQKMIVY
jgi:uncharacterized repeat protein (TIGR02059 family)